MSEPRPPRCVFDCVVLIQAAAHPSGPSGRCLRAAFTGEITLHTSRQTLREARRVLAYPSVRRAMPRLADVDVEAFLSEVRWRSVYHRVAPSVISLPRDAKDEPYLDLAVHADADVLTTRDRDLLDLAEGRDDAARRIRQFRPALRIVRPETLDAELSALRSRGT